MSVRNRLLVGILTTALSLGGVLNATVVSASHTVDPDKPCTCSASLSFAKPQLQFSGGNLVFTPRVNVSVRSRGNVEQPSWAATLTYTGNAAYESDDVTPPADTTFSGSQTVVSGHCGSRFNLTGLALPSVTLSGITQNMLGRREELAGLVKMEASLSGCDTDSEKRGFRFTVEELGNLSVRGWRSVR